MVAGKYCWDFILPLIIEAEVSSACQNVLLRINQKNGE